MHETLPLIAHTYTHTHTCTHICKHHSIHYKKHIVLQNQGVSIHWTTGLSYFSFLDKFVCLFVERSQPFLQSTSTWLLWMIVIITKIVYCSVFSILANVYTLENHKKFESHWKLSSCLLRYRYNTINGPIGRHCSTIGCFALYYLLSMAQPCNW